MKANMLRILCLMLALVMTVSMFAACNDEEEGSPTDVPSTEVSQQAEPSEEEIIIEPEADDPYTIEKDAKGKDVVILTPNEDKTVSATVAEGVTLKDVLAAVKAKEGFTVKVVDAKGKEVTDAKIKIAKGMIIQIIADGADAPEVEFAFDVVSKKEMEETVQEAEKQEASKEAAQKEDGKTPGNNTDKTPGKEDGKTPGKEDGKEDGKNDSTTASKKIVLSSVWGHSYTASDATGKAWQSTLKNMEKQQGIATTVNTLDPETATDTIVKEVMAGKASADIYDVSLAMCLDIARKGAAADVFKSKTLNKSAYSSGATKSATFGGKAYGVAFPVKSANPMGVIYNKDLIAKYASKYDLVKLYQTKKWTFDTFREVAKLCTKDTDGDGKIDLYGFTSNTNVIGMALSANAGGTALMVNGKVEATMCNDSGIAALEWCKELTKTDKSWGYRADIDESVNDFSAGKAAMFVSYLQYYPTIASKANFPLGFVLMPIGPDQSDYKNGVYDASLFIVPKTKEKRLDDIGLWLNGAASASNVLLNNKLTDLARNGFDNNAREIYKWVVNNMTPEYRSAFSSKVSAQVDQSVTSKTKSPAKVMNAIKQQAQKELDDYYAPLY